jgi:hypothetical protein
MAVNRTFALRLYIDRRRVKSHELTKPQARIFLKTARHLARYLKKAYKL